jgi:uncharacterized membrane protein YeaQ/YmgE (transglycosylase-associated protein family)
MSIVLWVLFGGLVGWVASLIMGTREGILMDVIIGIVGAVIGGWIMSIISGSAVVGSFTLSSFLVALLGAVILLAIVRAFKRA